MNAVVEEKVEPIPELMPNRLALAESLRIIWQATVEPGIERKDLLNPGFYKHVAPKLTPGTRIEIMPDDMTYFCEVIVVSSGLNEAVVRELRYIDLKSPEHDVSRATNKGYEVQFKGPLRKHCVVRLTDNHIIKENISLKEEAYKILDEYVKTISK